MGDSGLSCPKKKKPKAGKVMPGGNASRGKLATTGLSKRDGATWAPKKPPDDVYPVTAVVASIYKTPPLSLSHLPFPHSVAIPPHSHPFSLSGFNGDCDGDTQENKKTKEKRDEVVV